MSAHLRFWRLRPSPTAFRWAHASPLRDLLLTALCVCALMAQTLGLIHSVLHPHGGHATHTTAAASHAEADAAAHPPHGGLKMLFSGHEAGTAGCTLFDQLTHADGLASLPALPLAFEAPVHPDAVHAAWHHATQVTGFLARAPPAIG